MLTIASILTTTALFSLAMVLVLGSLLRSPVAGVREWFFANLAMVVSLPLLGLRDAIPDFISIVLGNTVLSLAGLLYYAGCARFLSRPVPWLRLAAGVFLVGIAMAVWRYGYNSVPLRVVASTAYNSAICVAIGVILLRHRPRERSPYNFWFAGSLSFVFAATQLVRGVYFLVVPPVDATIMFSNIWNIGLLTVGAVIMPTMTMVAVMMVHDDMLAKVEDAANRDHLTGAWSRKRFENIAQGLLAQASAAQPLSLLLIDLDHFKRINDSCGHAGGDEVLRAFVRMAHGSARPGDALGRLGGEEFGMLLPATTPAEAARIAEDLRCAAEQDSVVGDFGQLSVCRYSISVGIATTLHQENLERLSARADRALYVAKNSGRNQVSSGEFASSAPADAEIVKQIGKHTAPA